MYSIKYTPNQGFPMRSFWDRVSYSRVAIILELEDTAALNCLRQLLKQESHKNKHLIKTTISQNTSMRIIKSLSAWTLLFAAAAKAQQPYNGTGLNYVSCPSNDGKNQEIQKLILPYNQPDWVDMLSIANYFRGPIDDKDDLELKP